MSTLSNIPLKGPIHPVHPPVKISPISKGIEPTTLNKLIAEEPVDTPSMYVSTDPLELKTSDTYCHAPIFADPKS